MNDFIRNEKVHLSTPDLSVARAAWHHANPNTSTSKAPCTDTVYVRTIARTSAPHVHTQWCATRTRSPLRSLLTGSRRTAEIACHSHAPVHLRRTRTQPMAQCPRKSRGSRKWRTVQRHPFRRRSLNTRERMAAGMNDVRQRQGSRGGDDRL